MIASSEQVWRLDLIKGGQGDWGCDIKNKPECKLSKKKGLEHNGDSTLRKEKKNNQKFLGLSE